MTNRQADTVIPISQSPLLGGGGEGEYKEIKPWQSEQPGKTVFG